MGPCSVDLSIPAQSLSCAGVMLPHHHPLLIGICLILSLALGEAMLAFMHTESSA